MGGGRRREVAQARTLDDGGGVRAVGSLEPGLIMLMYVSVLSVLLGAGCWLLPCTHTLCAPPARRMRRQQRMLAVGGVL